MSEALAEVPGVTLPSVKDGEWTWADLDALPGEVRHIEIVEGSLIVSPSPSRPHQFAARQLCTLLAEGPHPTSSSSQT